MTTFTQALKWASRSTDDHAITIIMDAVAKADILELDILDEVDVGKYSVPTLVAILRATYPYRSLLSGWTSLRERTDARCVELGYNPRQILRGLNTGPKEKDDPYPRHRPSIA